jgi:serine/threonine-protein kinase RsbT
MVVNRMPSPNFLIVPIKREEDIIWSRQQGREVARELGFGMVDQSRIATAISELTRNILRFAGEGQCVIRPLSDNGRVGIEVVCEDNGPGIADIQAALRDGFSTSGGAGMGIGLPGTRRLMDEMQIESAPSKGTKIVIRRWRKS